MSDNKPTEPRTTPEPVSERPEIKSLIDKARAYPEQRIPQGTIKTGADIPGGGGTKSLELPDKEKETPARS